MDESMAIGCSGCEPGATRREFFAALGLAAAALALIGVPADARALPVRFMESPPRNSNDALYPLPETDSVNIDKENAVILVRHAGAIYAFRLSCPHKRTALRWKEANQRFECPKHKSKYEPDGTFISGRATRSMDRLGIRVKNRQVIVALSEVYLQDKDPEGWAAALVRV